MSNIIEGVSLCGPICPLDQKPYKIAHCLGKCHGLCGVSKPLMYDAFQSYPVIEDEYHTTELLNPPKIIKFRRTHPYYSTIDKMIPMSFGRWMHSAMEQAARELNEKYGYTGEAEVPFSIKIDTKYGEKTIVGKIDLVEEHRLLDYKTVGSYFVKKLREGWDETTYDFQLNDYNIFSGLNKDKLTIEAIVKDFTQRFAKEMNILERFDVPIYGREEMYDMARKSIEDSLEEHPRDCTDKERWYNPRNGKYNRCNGWCPVYTCFEYSGPEYNPDEAI